MYSTTDPSQALRFIGIKSHPLLVRGKSRYICTDAEHSECLMPFLPTIFGKRFGENVSRHFVGFAVLYFTEAEVEGNIM